MLRKECTAVLASALILSGCVAETESGGPSVQQPPSGPVQAGPVGAAPAPRSIADYKRQKQQEQAAASSTAPAPAPDAPAAKSIGEYRKQKQEEEKAKASSPPAAESPK
jgi:hypothetical protein